MRASHYPELKAHRVNGVRTAPCQEMLDRIAEAVTTYVSASPVAVPVVVVGNFVSSILLELQDKGLGVLVKASKPDPTLQRFLDELEVEVTKTIPDGAVVVIDSVLDGTAVKDTRDALKAKAGLVLIHNAMPRLQGVGGMLLAGPKAYQMLAETDYEQGLVDTVSIEGGRRGLGVFTRRYPVETSEVAEIVAEPEVVETTVEPEVVETTVEPEVVETTVEPEESEVSEPEAAEPVATVPKAKPAKKAAKKVAKKAAKKAAKKVAKKAPK